jgi:hypothetical protein
MSNGTSSKHEVKLDHFENEVGYKGSGDLCDMSYYPSPKVSGVCHHCSVTQTVASSL